MKHPFVSDFISLPFFLSFPSLSLSLLSHTLFLTRTLTNTHTGRSRARTTTQTASFSTSVPLEVLPLSVINMGLNPLGTPPKPTLLYPTLTYLGFKRGKKTLENESTRGLKGCVEKDVRDTGGPEPSAVERIQHKQDSHGQNLALVCAILSTRAFKTSARLEVPNSSLSSEFSTSKTVTARVWPSFEPFLVRATAGSEPSALQQIQHK